MISYDYDIDNNDDDVYDDGYDDSDHGLGDEMVRWRQKKKEKKGEGEEGMGRKEVVVKQITINT